MVSVIQRILKIETMNALILSQAQSQVGGCLVTICNQTYTFQQGVVDTELECYWVDRDLLLSIADVPVIMCMTSCEKGHETSLKDELHIGNKSKANGL